jgi:hypothetical protein
MYLFTLLLVCISLGISAYSLKLILAIVEANASTNKQSDQTTMLFDVLKKNIHDELEMIRNSIKYEAKVITGTKIDLMALQDKFAKTKPLAEKIVELDEKMKLVLERIDIIQKS